MDNRAQLIPLLESVDVFRMRGARGVKEDGKSCSESYQA
jgi:hypothetical protein